MGREISYCTSCGNRLLPNEGRGSCRTCRPASELPPAPRRNSSTRLRQQPPAPRPRETTRVRKRSLLPVVISVVAVVALALAIAIAAGGPSLPPPASPNVAVAAPAEPPAAPPAPPAPTVDETLARVREMRGSDLLFERREEILRMLKAVAARAGGRLEEVDQLAADYDRKYEEAAARLADFTRSEALRMASKMKFAEAIERVDGYPASFRASKSAELLRQLRQDLERRRAEPPAPSPTPPKRVL